MNNSAEQEARDLMEQCGWEDAQSCSAGEVVFLANKLRETQRLRERNAKQTLTAIDREGEIIDLNERIEELERDLDDAKYVVTVDEDQLLITRDQIRAAWSFRETDPNGCIDAALSCFNILPCEECGGSGVTSPTHELDAEDCPACNGEGWVVDNRQDTAGNDHKTAITGSKLQVTEDD